MRGAPRSFLVSLGFLALLARNSSQAAEDRSGGGLHVIRTATPECSADEAPCRRPPILLEPRRSADGWVAVGPFAGQTPTALLEDPGGPYLYAAIDEVGVFRRAALGSDWEQVEAGLTSTRFSALALQVIVPPPYVLCPPPCSGPAIMYAATRGDGVFVLRDGRWTADNSGLTDLDVTALTFDGGGVWAGTAGGRVFRNVFSMVGPQTWTAAASPGDGTAVRSLAVGSGTTVFSGTDGGLYRSTDSGASWSRLPHNAVQFLAAVRAIEVDPSDPSVVFAAGILSCTLCGIPEYPSIVKSTDGGDTWTEVTGDIGNPFVGSLLSVGGNLFAGTASGVFLSVDGGGSWTDTGLEGLDIASLAAAPDASDGTVSVAAGAVDAGIYQAAFPIAGSGDSAFRPRSPNGPGF